MVPRTKAPDAQGFMQEDRVVSNADTFETFATHYGNVLEKHKKKIKNHVISNPPRRSARLLQKMLREQQNTATTSENSRKKIRRSYSAISENDPEALIPVMSLSLLRTKRNYELKSRGGYTPAPIKCRRSATVSFIGDNLKFDENEIGSSVIKWKHVTYVEEQREVKSIIQIKEDFMKNFVKRQIPTEKKIKSMSGTSSVVTEQTCNDFFQGEEMHVSNENERTLKSSENEIKGQVPIEGRSKINYTPYVAACEGNDSCGGNQKPTEAPSEVVSALCSDLTALSCNECYQYLPERQVTTESPMQITIYPRFDEDKQEDKESSQCFQVSPEPVGSQGVVEIVQCAEISNVSLCDFKDRQIPNANSTEITITSTEQVSYERSHYLQDGDDYGREDDRGSVDRSCDDRSSRDGQSDDEQSDDGRSDSRSSGDRQSEGKRSEDRSFDDRRSGFSERDFVQRRSEGRSFDGFVDEQSNDRRSEDRNFVNRPSDDRKSEDKSLGGRHSVDKRSASDDRQSDDENFGDRIFVDRSSDETHSDDEQSDDRSSEDGSSEDGSSVDGSSEDGSSEDGSSDERQPGDRRSEDRRSPDRITISSHEDSGMATTDSGSDNIHEDLPQEGPFCFDATARPEVNSLVSRQDNSSEAIHKGTRTVADNHCSYDTVDTTLSCEEQGAVMNDNISYATGEDVENVVSHPDHDFISNSHLSNEAEKNEETAVNHDTLGQDFEPVQIRIEEISNDGSMPMVIECDSDVEEVYDDNMNQRYAYYPPFQAYSAEEYNRTPEMQPNGVDHEPTFAEPEMYCTETPAMPEPSATREEYPSSIYVIRPEYNCWLDVNLQPLSQVENSFIRQGAFAIKYGCNTTILTGLLHFNSENENSLFESHFMQQPPPQFLNDSNSNSEARSQMEMEDCSQESREESFSNRYRIQENMNKIPDQVSVEQAQMHRNRFKDEDVMEFMESKSSDDEDYDQSLLARSSSHASPPRPDPSESDSFSRVQPLIRRNRKKFGKYALSTKLKDYLNQNQFQRIRLGKKANFSKPAKRVKLRKRRKRNNLTDDDTKRIRLRSDLLKSVPWTEENDERQLEMCNRQFIYEIHFRNNCQIAYVVHDKVDFLCPDCFFLRDYVRYMLGLTRFEEYITVIELKQNNGK